MRSVNQVEQKQPGGGNSSVKRKIRKFYLLAMPQNMPKGRLENHCAWPTFCLELKGNDDDERGVCNVQVKISHLIIKS